MFDELFYDEPFYHSSDIRREMGEFEDGYWDEWELEEDPTYMEDPWSDLHVVV